MSEPNKSPLQRAIDEIGTAQDFAKKLGITPQAVSQWREVPALRVLQVERLTGVSRYELRPDIYGDAPATSSPPHPTEPMALAG